MPAEILNSHTAVPWQLVEEVSKGSCGVFTTNVQKLSENFRNLSLYVPRPGCKNNFVSFQAHGSGKSTHWMGRSSTDGKRTHVSTAHDRFWEGNDQCLAHQRCQAHPIALGVPGNEPGSPWSRLVASGQQPGKILFEATLGAQAPTIQEKGYTQIPFAKISSTLDDTSIYFSSLAWPIFESIMSMPLLNACGYILGQSVTKSFHDPTCQVSKVQELFDHFVSKTGRGRPVRLVGRCSPGMSWHVSYCTSTHTHTFCLYTYYIYIYIYIIYILFYFFLYYYYYY